MKILILLCLLIFGAVIVQLPISTYFFSVSSLSTHYFTVISLLTHCTDLLSLFSLVNGVDWKLTCYSYLLIDSLKDSLIDSQLTAIITSCLLLQCTELPSHLPKWTEMKWTRLCYTAIDSWELSQLLFYRSGINCIGFTSSWATAAFVNG
jgi:hypothetical protein